MHTRNHPELLAPAGGLEAAWSALHYGADAVYGGLRRFSARAEAENFTLESLEELIQFAHRRRPPARVFVTVNTLILEREIPDAVETIFRAAELGVDAFIVQDVGLARLIRRHFPGVRLHASTQMAVHNLEGALVLRDLGFARGILARELSLDEIRHISRNCGIETEVFVHGALCYSYSGLCLFSSHALGRSGNRGRCAYCCRETFSVPAPDGRGHRNLLPFSMKDLSLAGMLDDLRDAGVAGLKIEGRMKSPLYVGAVTDYYRRRLDGKLKPDDIRRLEDDIQTVFSRPWTQFHLRGPSRDVIDPLNVGHRGVPVGRVGAVRTPRRGEAWLRFRTRRALEKHDGLQIDLPASPRPFGFAVDEIRLIPRSAGSPARRVIEAPAGSDVEVRLPRGYPPIPANAVVYCSSSQDVKRRYRYPRPRPGACRHQRRISMKAAIAPDALRISAAAEDSPELAVEVTVSGDFGRAKEPGKTRDALRKALERLGETEWTLGAFDLGDPGQLFVPVSVMNKARRLVAEALTEKRRAQSEERLTRIRQSIAPPQVAAASRSAVEWSVKTDSAAMLKDFPSKDLETIAEFVILLTPERTGEPNQIADAVPREKVRLALPAICRLSETDALKQTIARLWSAGWRRWEIANIGAFRLLADAVGPDVSGLDLTADWPLYTMNSQAAGQWIDLGVRRFVLSPEDDEKNMLALMSLLGSRAIVPVFQYTPLFISESPPVLQASRVDPPAPDADAPVVIRSGSEQKCLIHRQGQRAVVCSQRPFCLSGLLAPLKKAGARSFRIDLVHAPQRGEELVRLWHRLAADQTVPGSHPGNFHRGVV